MTKKKNSWNKPKKWVFEKENWINVSLSHPQYLLCNISKISWNTLCIPFSTIASRKTVKTKALINYGAGGTFINQNFAKNFDIQKLKKLITAKNVDGTINKKGTIESYVEIEFQINSQKLKKWFYVTGLGKQRIILGFPWLHKHNHIINWKTGKITWKDFQLNFQKWFEKKKPIPKTTIEGQSDEEEEKNQTQNPIDTDTNAIFMEFYEEIKISKIILAIEENKKKEEKTDEELVPEEYHEYLDVFSEEKAAQFPETKPWDHKIKMKEGFELKSFKN